MKKASLLLIAIIFISCKKESQDDHINTFPVEVRDYVREFLKEGENRGVKLDIKKIHHIKFIDKIPASPDLDNHTVAFYSHSDKNIYIDSSQYDYKVNPEAVLFHELGHGLLKRVHRNILFSDNVNPVSIMYYSAAQAWFKTYGSFRQDYYFDELFHESTPYPSWTN